MPVSISHGASRTSQSGPFAIKRARYSVYTKCLTGFVGEPVMQDPLSKADRYWKEAAKCYELAKSTPPPSSAASIGKPLCSSSLWRRVN
jgi:hypothetical protein